MTAESEITIRRGIRTKNFTVVDNTIITLVKLTPRARLALIYLLSRPDDWVLQITDLRRVLGTSDRYLGRDTAYAVVEELVAVGYIEKEQLLAPDGRFQGVRYTVWDEPFQSTLRPFSGSKPNQENDHPVADFRAMEPGPENQETVKTTRENGVNFENQPPYPKNQETVPLPLPGFPDPVNQDLTKDRPIARTESPLPFPQPSRDHDAHKIEGGFEAFWRDWPERTRPKFYAAGEKLFLGLKVTERELAARLSPAYRTLCDRRSQMALMIPYLRKRKFLDLAEGPPIDPDGYFRIEPGRAEWDAWLNHYSAKFSPERAKSLEDLGYVLTTSRWPQDASMALQSAN